MVGVSLGDLNLIDDNVTALLRNSIQVCLLVKCSTEMGIADTCSVYGKDFKHLGIMQTSHPCSVPT